MSTHPNRHSVRRQVCSATIRVIAIAALLFAATIPAPATALAVNVSLNAVHDEAFGAVGVPGSFDVSVNDSVPTSGDFHLTGAGSFDGSPAIDIDSGVVTYTPTEADRGSLVDIEYDLCFDGAEPGGESCDQAILTVVVPNTLDAVPDEVFGEVGVATIFDVSANDDVPTNGVLSLTGAGSYDGDPDIGPDSGVVTYTPTLADRGSLVDIEYELCFDGVDPGDDSCDRANLTIVVPNTLDAVDDEGEGAAEVAGSFDVSANDDVPANGGFSLTGVGTFDGVPSIDSATGVVSYTPTLADRGSFVEIEYELCFDGVDPGSESCDRATLSVLVPNTLDAVHDEVFGALDTPGSFDVSVNDDVPTNGGFSLTGAGTYDGVPSIDAGTGIVSYTPTTADRGSLVDIEYELCFDGADPGDESCDRAILTVVVPNTLDAVDDDGEGAAEVAGSFDVSVNDDVPTNGGFSLTGVGTFDGVPSIDSGTGVVSYTPTLADRGSFVEIEYELCFDGVDPGDDSCDRATLTVVVPNTLDAVHDEVFGAVDVPGTFDVSVNDDVPTNGGFSLTGAGTYDGLPSIDAGTGIVSYTPTTADRGSLVDIEYELCFDGVDPGDDSCDRATLTVVVPNTLDAVDDEANGAAEVPSTIDVSVNDDVPANGGFSLTGVGTYDGVPSIDGTTGVVSYTPTIADGGTSVQIEYELCFDGVDPGDASCDRAVLTILVEQASSFSATASPAPTATDGVVENTAPTAPERPVRSVSVVPDSDAAERSSSSADTTSARPAVIDAAIAADSDDLAATEPSAPAAVAEAVVQDGPVAAAQQIRPETPEAMLPDVSASVRPVQIDAAPAVLAAARPAPVAAVAGSTGLGLLPLVGMLLAFSTVGTLLFAAKRRLEG